MYISSTVSFYEINIFQNKITYTKWKSAAKLSDFLVDLYRRNLLLVAYLSNSETVLIITTLTICIKIIYKQYLFRNQSVIVKKLYLSAYLEVRTENRIIRLIVRTLRSLIENQLRFYLT